MRLWWCKCDVIFIVILWLCNVMLYLLWYCDALTRKGRLWLAPICQTAKQGVLLRPQIDGLGWHYELLIMSIWSLNYTNIINHQTFQTCYNHAQPLLQRYLCQLKSCQWAIILLSQMMINSDLPSLTDLSAALADSFFLLSFNYSLSELHSVLGSLVVLLNMNLRYKMDRFNWHTRRYY